MLTNINEELRDKVTIPVLTPAPKSKPLAKIPLGRSKEAPDSNAKKQGGKSSRLTRAFTLPINEDPSQQPELSEEEKVIQKLRTEVLILEKNISDLKTQNKEFVQKINDFELKENRIRIEKEKEEQKNVKMSSFATKKTGQNDQDYVKLQKDLKICQTERNEFEKLYEETKTSLSKKLNKINEKNEELTKEISDMQEEIENVDDQKSDLESKMSDLRDEFNKLKKETKERVLEKKNLTDQIVQYEQQIIKMNCEIEDLKGTLYTS